MSFPTPYLRRSFLFGSACLLLASATIGLIHAVRATVAQGLYWQCKFGSVSSYPSWTRLSATQRRCEMAHRLYPYNYWFCIWTAELAWYSRLDPHGQEMVETMHVAELWCDRGLALNPWKSSLHLLKTRLLQRRNVADALHQWETYVNWHFWDPYHHAVLAELRALVGDFVGALESLDWVRGSSHYAEAAARIQSIWEQQHRRRPSLGQSVPSLNAL